MKENNLNNKSGKELNCTVGEVVIVLSKKNDRGIWPLGKILKIFPHSGDGVVRKLEILMPDKKVMLKSVAHVLKLAKESTF